MPKQTGNMYKWITDSFNPIGGKCPHKCKYCYAQNFQFPSLKEKYSGLPRLYENELKRNLGKDKFWFVGSCFDVWADDIPVSWISKTLRHCSEYPENKYLFQTKNPERIYRYRVSLPEKSIIGTTVESNRWYKEMGNAPHPIVRASVLALKQIRMFETMLTIEPIMDFDIDFMVEMVKAVNPNWVNIGANTNPKVKLQEPSSDKIDELIAKLKEITEVKIKPNLKRLMPK